MSVTSGFFNSLNNDRRYNSNTMSEIFDGIINDGVFMNIGNTFSALATTGNSITIDTGKCWFNSSWLKNDALLPLTLEQSEVLLDRIDAIVIEVNHSINVREARIVILKGTPASTPVNPSMLVSEYVNQHPIAYIKRPGGKAAITQSDITMVVGTVECPYITGILKTANIDALLLQWGSQWGDWTTEQKIEFQDWFESLNNILDGDIAANLTLQIYRIENVTKVLLKTDNWEGIEAPFVQTVMVPEANEKSTATLVRTLDDNATVQEQIAYTRAFTFISSGSARLGADAFNIINYAEIFRWTIGNYNTNGNLEEDPKYTNYEDLISVGSNKKIKIEINYRDSEGPLNIKCDIVIFNNLNTFLRRINHEDLGGLYVPEESDGYFYLIVYDGDNLLSGASIINQMENGRIQVNIGFPVGSATFKVYKKPETDITVGLKGIGTNDFYKSTSIILDANGSIIQE